VARLSIGASPRKSNMDGTWNSICIRCFQTIATHKLEVEVEKIEKTHVCSPLVLSQRGVRASLGSSR
jgi:hypothetical protein